MSSFSKRVDEYVGEQVRKRRTELGMTQHDLAAHLAISYQQVQKYETGANRVSSGRLLEIAQKLEVPVQYFFDGLDPMSKTVPMEHGGKSRATIEVARNFAEIEEPELRAAVAGLMKSLAGRPRKRTKN